MIPIGFDRNADEDGEEDLRNAPGCDDKYRNRVNNPHHVDVSEDLIELKQERHLQRCHGDVVGNHGGVSNLFGSLDQLQFTETRQINHLCTRGIRAHRSHAREVFRHKNTLQDVDREYGRLKRHVSKAEPTRAQLEWHTIAITAQTSSILTLLMINLCVYNLATTDTTVRVVTIAPNAIVALAWVGL